MNEIAFWFTVHPAVDIPRLDDEDFCYWVRQELQSLTGLTPIEKQLVVQSSVSWLPYHVTINSGYFYTRIDKSMDECIEIAINLSEKLLRQNRLIIGATTFSFDQV